MATNDESSNITSFNNSPNQLNSNFEENSSISCSSFSDLRSSPNTSSSNTSDNKHNYLQTDFFTSNSCPSEIPTKSETSYDDTPVSDKSLMNLNHLKKQSTMSGINKNAEKNVLTHLKPKSKSDTTQHFDVSKFSESSKLSTMSPKSPEERRNVFAALQSFSTFNVSRSNSTRPLVSSIVNVSTHTSSPENVLNSLLTPSLHCSKMNDGLSVNDKFQTTNHCDNVVCSSDKLVSSSTYFSECSSTYVSDICQSITHSLVSCTISNISSSLSSSKSFELSDETQLQKTSFSTSNSLTGNLADKNNSIELTIDPKTIDFVEVRSSPIMSTSVQQPVRLVSPVSAETISLLNHSRVKRPTARKTGPCSLPVSFQSVDNALRSEIGDNECDATASEAPLLDSKNDKDVEQAKLPDTLSPSKAPRARKSAPNKKLRIDHSSVVKQAPNIGFTVNISEFESALGIKEEGIEKLNAKTLDSILLKKARLFQRARMSPLKSHGIKTSTEALKSYISNSIGQTNGKKSKSHSDTQKNIKRKKRKMGTYSLPSQRRKRKLERSSSNKSTDDSVKNEPLSDDSEPEEVRHNSPSDTVVKRQSARKGCQRAVNNPGCETSSVGGESDSSHASQTNKLNSSNAQQSFNSSINSKLHSHSSFSSDDFDSRRERFRQNLADLNLLTSGVQSNYREDKQNQEFESNNFLKKISPENSYTNTPNGLSYPAINDASFSDSNSQSPKDISELDKHTGRESDLIALCSCRISGSTTPLSRFKHPLYCQALDSIDGAVIGCSSKISVHQPCRPSVRIPFMLLCDLHLRQLRQHHCCPGCGQFCSQGKFYVCQKTEDDGTHEPLTIIHHFHPKCQVYKQDKYYCPHCGDESAQQEVLLRRYVQQPRPADMSLTEPNNLQHKSAKMTLPKHKDSNQVDSEKAETKDEETCSTLRIPSGKELSAAELPSGPSKTELESAIKYLSSQENSSHAKPNLNSLHTACQSGELKKVIHCLAEGVHPNIHYGDHENETVLHSAARSGYHSIVHVLIQAGASVNTLDNSLISPLMLAVEHNNLSVARLLIKSGATLDAKTDEGMTPLHICAKAGNYECVKLLVETRSIDINAKDDGGWTPIVWASEFRHINVIRYLLSQHADPNIKDAEENTALHWASFAGSVDTVELLLNHSCDVESVNLHGDRPLHIAARQDHYQCVALLLARGAKSDARNNANDLPVQCCIDKSSMVSMTLQINLKLRQCAGKRQQKTEKLLHRDISIGRESYPIPVVNSIDSENYPQDFHYVADNVETIPLNVNKSITSFQSCNCSDNCASVFCACTRASVRCSYNKEGCLVEEFNMEEPSLIFECNKACKCWATCQNRVVQSGITCRLQVFRTNGRGWGLRTLQDIPRGSFVCEYVGEHISDAEADSREDDSYLFDLDNKDTDTFCIDARKYANIGRFINHLCEPNVIPVKVFFDHQDLRFPRICFFSSRRIAAYEELGFDYGEKFWIIKWKSFTCECGSLKCKYSKETIHRTIEDYNQRREAENESDSD